MAEPGSSPESDRETRRARAKRRLRAGVIVVAAAMALALIAIIIVFVLGVVWAGTLPRFYDWLFYAPEVRDSATLTAVASVAAVLWTGGLISFTLRRRYSARLANGLWLLAVAFLAPLARMAVPGSLLHPLGIELTIAFGTASVWQLSLERRMRNHLKKRGMDARIVAGTKDDPPDRNLSEYFTDRMNRIFQGWPATGAAAVLSIATLINAGVDLVALAALVALALGLVHSFTALINYPLDDHSDLFLVNTDAVGAGTAQKPRGHVET